MDDPHFRQRHPNVPPYPSTSSPYPSAPPFPDPPSASSRLYPDLNAANSGGDVPAAAPPPPGFHGYDAPPYAGAHAPPPPHHHTPPPPPHRTNHRPTTVCDAIREKIILVLIGVVLFCGGVGVTFWNEGRTVKRSAALEEGLTMVTSLKASPRDGRISASYELTNSLVHLTEKLSIPKGLTDPRFNVVVRSAKLKRVVEMLQWVETEHGREVTNENGETRTEYSYDYTQEWRTTLIHSVGFNSPGHRNPDTFPLEGQTFEADEVYVGPFSISPSLLVKIDWFSPHDISGLHAHLLPMGSKRFENWIYFGASPSRPAIGDFRVSFLAAGVGDPVNAETVSVVAKQTTPDARRHGAPPSLAAFETSNGDLIDFVYRGAKTKEQIFSSERKSNLFFSWIMRGAGWLLMFIGVLSIVDLVTSVFSGIPILRDLAAMTSLTLSLVISGMSSLVVIALGWCVHRPWFAFVCLAIAVTPFLVARFRRIG